MENNNNPQGYYGIQKFNVHKDANYFLRQEIIPFIRRNVNASEALQDHLIILVANYWGDKYGKVNSSLIRKKIQYLGHMLSYIKEHHRINNLMDLFCPEILDIVFQFIKAVSGFNDDNFQRPVVFEIKSILYHCITVLKHFYQYHKNNEKYNLVISFEEMFNQRYNSFM